MDSLHLLRSIDDATRREFRDWLRTEFLATPSGLPDDASHAAIMIMDELSPFPVAADSPDAICDAVLEIASDSAPDLSELAKKARIQTLAVEPRVIKDDIAPERCGRVAGTALLSLVVPVPGMRAEETLRHWTEHAPLAIKVHHGMVRYVQTVILPVAGHASPWFGMAYLHFPRFDRIPQDLFRTPDDVAQITQDVAEFAADSPVLYATRHVLKAST